jgi:hypothetical protein
MRYTMLMQLTPEIEALARDLAMATGETPEAALATAARERLARVQPSPPSRRERPTAARTRFTGLAPEQRTKAERLLAMGRAFVAGTTIDARSPDELLYDADGLPT